MAAEVVTQKRASATKVGDAITCLVTAGMMLLEAREGCKADVQELITALRDDVTRLVGDAETVRSVIQGV